jgi:hypothetical protein
MGPSRSEIAVLPKPLDAAASLLRRTGARNPVHVAAHLIIVGHMFPELRFGHADLFRETCSRYDHLAAVEDFPIDYLCFESQRRFEVPS